MIYVIMWGGQSRHDPEPLAVLDGPECLNIEQLHREFHEEFGLTREESVQDFWGRVHLEFPEEPGQPPSKDAFVQWLEKRKGFISIPFVVGAGGW